MPCVRVYVCVCVRAYMNGVCGGGGGGGGGRVCIYFSVCSGSTLIRQPAHHSLQPSSSLHFDGSVYQ